MQQIFWPGILIKYGGEKDDEKRALISSLQTETESGTNSRNVKAMKFDRDFEIIIRCFARVHSRFWKLKEGRQLKARL